MFSNAECSVIDSVRMEQKLGCTRLSPWVHMRVTLHSRGWYRRRQGRRDIDRRSFIVSVYLMSSVRRPLATELCATSRHPWLITTRYRNDGIVKRLHDAVVCAIAGIVIGSF